MSNCSICGRWCDKRAPSATEFIICATCEHVGNDIREYAHKYEIYQPTEYEQLMIAAGWISSGSCDPDYLKYENRAKRQYIYYSDYRSWLDARQKWNSLVAEYQKQFAVPQCELDHQQLIARAKLRQRLDSCDFLINHGSNAVAD